MGLFKRILKIGFGALIIAGGSQDTLGFWGFRPPVSAFFIGWDLSEVAIYVGCGWLIYRGFKTKTKLPSPVQ